MNFHQLLFTAILIPFLSFSQTKPRIAITGLAIESSTFSPAKSRMDAFIIKEKEDLLNSYPFFKGHSTQREAAIWFPGLRGSALPGGIVTRATYDSLVNKSLTLLKENLPYDGLFFDIHGAMSVEGLDDPEGDFLEKIRKVIGNSTIVSTSMDLHGNVSEKLAHLSDLITCYRMAPHEDALESKQRAVDNLLDRIISNKGKPAYKAYINVPVLLPGEKTSTRVEPGKSLYSLIPKETKKSGVLDAAIWIGYAWADEPRNHAVVMVTGDNQKEVKESAEKLAKEFWRVRKDFKFVAPTTNLNQALEKALNSEKKPFFISDMGDNPTAGGAGDVSWTIRELLKYPEFYKKGGPKLIYASIPGPEMIQEALNVGIGGNVSAPVGAMVDSRYSPPVTIKGKVKSIHHGDIHAETEVVIETGNIDLIVTKKRKPYHYIKDFTDLGLDIPSTDIVIVKIGYLVPELFDAQADWLMALTPGGVDQDLERLPYKRISRPMFPLEKEFEVDLSVKWIPVLK